MLCCVGELYTRKRATSAGELGVDVNVALSWTNFAVFVRVLSLI